MIYFKKPILNTYFSSELTECVPESKLINKEPEDLWQQKDKTVVKTNSKILVKSIPPIINAIQSLPELPLCRSSLRL